MLLLNSRSQGAGGRAEISVVVTPTEAPVVFIDTKGENYYSDELIQFSALVSDTEDDAEELIDLTSSVDGELRSITASIR